MARQVLWSVAFALFTASALGSLIDQNCCSEAGSYITGVMSSGATGTGPPATNHLLPTEHPWFRNKQVLDICLRSGDTAIILLRNPSSGANETYLLGSNAASRLGLPYLTVYSEPVLIQTQGNVERIFCAYDALYYLTSNRELYGYESQFPEERAPTADGSFRLWLTDVYDFAPGSTHRVAIRFSNYSLWGWGDNSRCSLGFNNTLPGNSRIRYPTYLGLYGYEKVAVTTANGASTIAYNSTNSKILVFGVNTQGMLGPGQNPLCDPQTINVASFVDPPYEVRTSAHSSFVFGTFNGRRAFRWVGLNSYYLLGSGYPDNYIAASPETIDFPWDGFAIDQVRIFYNATHFETSGYNYFGACGDGTTTLITGPVIHSLAGIQGAAVSTYAGAVWTNSSLYIWGTSTEYLFLESIYIKPTLVTNDNSTRFFGAATTSRTFMYNSTGLFATGSNINGALGMSGAGVIFNWTLVPAPVPSKANTVEIISASFTSIIIATPFGDSAAAGIGGYATFQNVSSDHFYQFSQVSPAEVALIDPNVTKICLSYLTTAVVAGGKAFTGGTDYNGSPELYGSLGQNLTEPQTTVTYTRFKELTAFSPALPSNVKIVDCAAGYQYFMLLTSEGSVYFFGAGWGYGLNTTLPTTVPTLVPELANITGLSICSSSNLAWNQNTNELWSWGTNSAYHLCHLDSVVIRPKKFILDPILGRIARAEMADSYSLFLMDTGILLGCGQRPSMGLEEIPVYNLYTQSEPVLIHPRVRDFAASPQALVISTFDAPSLPPQCSFYGAIFINGTCIIVGTVQGIPEEVSDPVTILGSLNLQLNTTLALTFPATISVPQGCVVLSGTLRLNVSATGDTTVPFASTGCVSGAFQRIEVVGSDAKCTIYNPSTSFNGQQLSILLSPSPDPSAECAPQAPSEESTINIPVAIGVSIGAAVLVAVVLIILFATVPRLRDLARPFNSRRPNPHTL